MGPKTLFLRPLYYSTLIVSIIDPPFKEPFKGTPILIIKAPILYDPVSESRRHQGFVALEV